MLKSTLARIAVKVLIKKGMTDMKVKSCGLRFSSFENYRNGLVAKLSFFHWSDKTYGYFISKTKELLHG